MGDCVDRPAVRVLERDSDGHVDVRSQCKPVVVKMFVAMVSQSAY